MNQSQTLEAALAEAEQMLAEQNAELDAAFARLESLGSSSIHVDGQELAELATFQPAPTRPCSQTFAGATRC
jgi:hypothetical protein